MKTVRATEYVQLMYQGRSRSQLVLASDGNRYVLKLLGNPQGSRILANECVAGSLADAIGAPCVPRAVVQVDEPMASQINAKMRHLLPAEKLEFKAGLQFGSLYLGLGWPFPTDDPVKILPSTAELMSKTSNASTWPSSIVFNALVQNEDQRHTHILVTLDTTTGGSSYQLIDHGHTLAVDRGWRDLRVEGISLKEPLYPLLVEGHDPFREPLARLDALTPSSVGEMLANCPLREWGVGKEDEDALVRYIAAAKPRVADVVRGSRALFPRWT